MKRRVYTKNAPSSPAASMTVNVSPASVRAIALAVAKILDERLPTAARLAAADTTRTVERTETVLSRALDEGEKARQLIAGRTEKQDAEGE